MTREQCVYWLLRVGTAFAFLYPPLAALSDPTSWFAYFPRFIRALPVDPLLLLHGFGIIEVILALWILFGRTVRIPAAIAAALLLVIVAFNFAQIDIVFRDISIALMTLALVCWPRVMAPETGKQNRQ